MQSRTYMASGKCSPVFKADHIAESVVILTCGCAVDCQTTFLMRCSQQLTFLLLLHTSVFQVAILGCLEMFSLLGNLGKLFTEKISYFFFLVLRPGMYNYNFQYNIRFLLHKGCWNGVAGCNCTFKGEKLLAVPFLLLFNHLTR